MTIRAVEACRLQGVGVRWVHSEEYAYSWEREREKYSACLYHSAWNMRGPCATYLFWLSLFLQSKSHARKCTKNVTSSQTQKPKVPLSPSHFVFFYLLKLFNLLCLLLRDTFTQTHQLKKNAYSLVRWLDLVSLVLNFVIADIIIICFCGFQIAA